MTARSLASLPLRADVQQAVPITVSQLSLLLLFPELCHSFFLFCFLLFLSPLMAFFSVAVQKICTFHMRGCSIQELPGYFKIHRPIHNIWVRAVLTAQLRLGFELAGAEKAQGTAEVCFSSRLSMWFSTLQCDFMEWASVEGLKYWNSVMKVHLDLCRYAVIISSHDHLLLILRPRFRFTLDNKCL